MSIDTDTFDDFDFDDFYKMDIADIKGNYSEMEQVSRRLISSDPNNAKAYRYLGNSLLHQGKLDEAVTNFQTSIRLDPSDSSSYISLGDALSWQGNLEDAVINFRTAIHLRPNFVRLYNDIGMALHEQGNLDDAITNYRTAISIYPKYKASYLNLGFALHSQDEDNLLEAFENYCIGVDLNYNDFDNAIENLISSIYVRAVSNKNTKYLLQAVQSFRIIIFLSPECAEAYYQLGVILAFQGKLKEAITNYQTTIQLEPNHVKAQNSLKEVELQLAAKNVCSSTSTSSCFIATAAYSTSIHPDLDTFRSFRDEKLLPHPLGAKLVNLYYKISPSLAHYIAQQPTIKKLLKHHLSRLANWMRIQKNI